METAEDAECLRTSASPEQAENLVLVRSSQKNARLSPRAFVRRIIVIASPNQGDNDLMSICNVSMLEEHKQRAEGHERWLWDREDEKIGRDREEKRHDKYMKILMRIAFGN